ncbi:MAG: helix-turn-helix transcriptional regulator [Marmoricola sp.]
MPTNGTRTRVPEPAQAPADMPRVVVMSSQQLIRDAIRTALRSMGFATASLAAPIGASRVHEVRRWIAKVHPAAGLLVTDLDDAARLREAVSVVTAFPLPWILLTDTPRGPLWGALFDAGAREILPTTATLEELSQSVLAIVSGDIDTGGLHEDAVRAWRDAGEEHHKLAHRLERLSPREMEILVELHDGDSVRVIAQRAGVSEGTVRSQVKSLLHKLKVSSQLQAVAAFRQANEWFGD